jgi:hypothetical protein
LITNIGNLRLPAGARGARRAKVIRFGFIINLVSFGGVRPKTTINFDPEFLKQIPPSWSARHCRVGIRTTSRHRV